MVLSRDQFSALTVKLHDPDDGGFSISTQTGKQPSNGWMVAVPGHEWRYPRPGANASDLQDYTEANSTALGKRGAHFGGWHEAGDDILDVSKRNPESPAGHSATRAAMVSGKQEASFRLSDWHTEHNPFHPAARNNTGKEPHEIANAAMKSPEFAAKQPEVKAWVNSPKERAKMKKKA